MIYSHWECDPMARQMYHYLRVELSEPLLGNERIVMMQKGGGGRGGKKTQTVSVSNIQAADAEATNEFKMKVKELKLARELAKEERDHFYAAFRGKYEN